MCSDSFIKLHCRDRITYFQKDSLILLPYIYNLVTKDNFAKSPMDEDGYILVDEEASTLYYLIDKYREWLEVGHLNYVKSKGLISSAAKRLGCDQDFINELQPIFTKELFKCYYCDNLFIKGEKSVETPCNYRCEESFKRARVPYHTEKELPFAKKRNAKNARKFKKLADQGLRDIREMF